MSPANIVGQPLRPGDLNSAARFRTEHVVCPFDDSARRRTKRPENEGHAGKKIP